MTTEQKGNLRNVMEVMSNAHKTGKHHFVFLQKEKSTNLFYLYKYYTLLETKSNKLDLRYNYVKLKDRCCRRLIVGWSRLVVGQSKYFYLYF